jgi:Bardet-Biedl syndrome 2 protein
VRRQISALACGDLENKERARDILLVGTHTNLLAYAVEANSDIFYKEVPDGVNALAFGNIPPTLAPLAVVGGNCSIQGFDAEGNELFWTVTGDNVSALAFRDPTGEGRHQLLVGSEDYEIRIFEKEEVICEVTESDVVSGLTFIRDQMYGYSLANGTIGVYNNDTRVWHAKSKHTVNALSAFDLDSDGVNELIAGWSNGRIEVRNDQVGELVYKDRFDSAIAQIVIADYRMDGRDEIIACSAEGEIRGYLPAEEEQQGELLDANTSENTLQSLFNRKQELLTELRGYENNQKQIKKGESAGGTIPPDTEITVTVQPDRESKSLLLKLETNNDTTVKLAIVFSELLFAEESIVVHPRNPTNQLEMPINPSKQIEADIFIKAVVGYGGGSQDHVFELTQYLPRFATFVFTIPGAGKPESTVSYKCGERANRIVLWIANAFCLLPQQVEQLQELTDSVSCEFMDVKTGDPLTIKMTGPTADGPGIVTIGTNSMELAGDIIQDMCKYLKITNLESTADFPREMEEFQAVLGHVEEYNDIRLKLSAEIADSSNMIKTLVIKAEDARILNDPEFMSKMYAQLKDLNGELVGEYTKRATNHEELLKSLKEVNHMIQKASRLRMGEFKSKVVALCRKAIKANNTISLNEIIRTGHAK